MILPKVFDFRLHYRQVAQSHSRAILDRRLEQIKDYVILRCIGATKGQLSSFIYLMGGVLEGTGMVLGILLGYISSKIIVHFIYVKSEMHVLPIFFIAIAFLGDLYFVMQENCKTVNKMTPVSAVRGEFRIKKEKIKARGKGIFGRLLGVEGEYAYKNIYDFPILIKKISVLYGVRARTFSALKYIRRAAYA